MTITVPRSPLSIGAKPNWVSLKTAATHTKPSSTTTSEPRTYAETSSTSNRHHSTIRTTRIRASPKRPQPPRRNATEPSTAEPSRQAPAPSRRTSAPTKRSSAWKRTSADKKPARRCLVASAICAADRYGATTTISTRHPVDRSPVPRNESRSSHRPNHRHRLQKGDHTTAQPGAHSGVNARLRADRLT